MKLAIYIIRDLARILFRRETVDHSDVIRGFTLYEKTHEPKKNMFRVIYELHKLCDYWDAFPDTYFRFGMFLISYSNEEKMKSFVPQDSYYRYSLPTDLRYNILLDDKILFHDLMSRYGLPVPCRLFTFRNNEFRDGNTLLTDDEVDLKLSSLTDKRIFVKRFTGGAASGVSIFIKQSNGKYVDQDGDVMKASTIREKYKNQSFFFEKQLIQEPVLSQFNPDTVNSIRVLTYKEKIISATVRFGGKGSFVDNTAKGGVAVSLDINTGVLQSFGMREYDLTKYYEHPGSHLKFENTVVTQWPEAKALVEKTLRFLPYYTSVGFDVATTLSGPVIIEINTGAGVYLSQMGLEYGLKNFFRK